MNTTQTQVRSTDEALSVFDTLKLALEALETHVPHVYKDRGYAPITAIKESLMSLCDGAQQPQNEVRGLSHSNEQSKCNHTKTITRADIDGNQIETTCGECGERVAQQPQDVVRGLLSNEQVEPVAKVNFYTGKIEWLMPVSFDIPVTIDVPPMYLYTHPPVPYVVEPRTAQPKEPLVINSQEKASEFIEKTLWEVIDVAAMFPKAKPNPRTWEHLMVYSPQPKPLTDEEIDVIADKFTVHTGEMWEPELCIEFNDSCKSVHSFVRAIEAAHGIKE